MNSNKIQWLKDRKKVLTASDVSAVIGINKWSSPIDVWMDKTSELVSDSEGTQSMRLGHKLQPIVAEEAAAMHGLTLLETEVFATSLEEPWAGATLDYLAKDSSGKELIVECKATHDLHWQDIPDYYQTQLAWQCWVHGVNHAKIAVLHASTRVETYDFNLLTADWFSDVVNHCREWWTDYVVNKVRPEASFDQLNWRNLIRAVPGKQVELDAGMVRVLQWISTAKAELKEAEDAIEAYTSKIKEILGDAEVGLYKDEIVATWRECKTSRFDTTAFKKEHPKLYAEFQKVSTSRRFLIKEIKSPSSSKQLEEVK